jgi:hypothetical protein
MSLSAVLFASPLEYAASLRAVLDRVREHARLGGFPANRISRIVTTIDPTTVEHL